MKLFKYIFIVILLLSTGKVFAQAQVVSGKVTEKVDGQFIPMVGVNVSLVNTQNRSVGGTVSDINGFYRVNVPANEKNLTLVYSYIGMKSQRIKYTGQDELNIVMEESASELGSVTVTGRRIERNDMGVSQQEMVTATQKIKMETLLATSPVTTIEEALQGQLGGVDIITGGGDPGARSAIRIRGTGSLNASSEPLIVIDGVPYSTTISEDFDFSTANDEDLGALLNIVPSDIEQIEVLKDAAATAIWGTKGANGVLVITTKKGREGKTSFTFSSKFSAKFEPSSIPMLNGSEYTAMIQEAIWNSANLIGLDTHTNKYLTLLYNTPEIGYSPDWIYFKEYNQDTDWLSEVRQTAYTWDNSFSMSGGGEKATYRFSLGYLTDEGTTIGSQMDRLNTSLNIDYQFSNKLKFGANFSYSQSDIDSSSPSKEGNVRAEAFRKMPNKSPYWINDEGERTSQYFSYQTSDFEGEFKEGDNARNYNPVAMALESKNNTIKRDSKIIFRVDYKIFPSLTYSGWASMQMSTSKNTKFLPQVATGVVWTSKNANQTSDASSDGMSIQTENKLLFMKNWNSTHNIIATGLFRTSQSMSSSYYSSTSGNASEGLSDPIIGSTVEGIGSGESENRSTTAIGMLNYTLLDRYVLQASITAEGNSAMGRDNRMGYFPTGGFSWNIQNEPFLENSRNWIDEIKLRLSWGQSGTPPEGSSLYLGAFTSLGNYMNMAAIQPVRMQLDKLKWETSTEYNIGGDFSFFSNRLRFTFDYYERYKKDLLQKDVKIPSSTGYGKIRYFNSGKMVNKGWEFRVDGILVDKKDWKISTYVNLSRNRNEITELPQNLTQENYSFGNENYAIRVEEGRPFGSFYGYRYKGVYQNKEATYARDAEGNVMNDVKGKPIIMKNGDVSAFPGDAIYEDINHDGVINQYDIVYLGNYMPIIMGGAGVTVKWRNLALSAFFHGRFGQKVINETRMKNEAMYNVNNQSKAVLRRWRNEGDITDIPRALYSEGYNYLGSDRFVEDASYVRLKSLSLNYTIPKSLCHQFGVTNLSIFATGYDLFTWTDYAGQDPEISIPSGATKLAKDGSSTPCSIRFACGFNLNF